MLVIIKCYQNVFHPQRKKKESILADRTTRDKLFWWTFFTAEATGLKLQLSHYPVSLLSRCMMRREFVWPPRGSTKGWIQSRAPRGQAGGGPSWGAPASHHLHTAAHPVSLDMNPHPPSLFPCLGNPPLLLLWQASSASQSYPSPTPCICPVHLICPSCSLNSVWQQHYGLSCEHSFHAVTELIFRCCGDNAVGNLLSSLRL